MSFCFWLHDTVQMAVIVFATIYDACLFDLRPQSLHFFKAAAFLLVQLFLADAVAFL
jgi:hypothetical protein